jgi:uncharacterized protein YfaP (DUF2135 family)
LIRGITPETDEKIRGKINIKKRFLGLLWAVLCLFMTLLLIITVFLPLLPIVKITSPKEGIIVEARYIEVTGKIKNYKGKVATLSVNGIKQTIAIENGDFTNKAVLFRGRNIIQVSASNKWRLGRDSVIVTSNVKATDLWVKLTWEEDKADVDLYVTEPNNSTAWFKTKTNVSGGFLDFDDTDGYGPEHYYISSLAGHKVDAGNYSIRVHYYEPHGYMGPINAEILVLKNEKYYNTYKVAISKANVDSAGPGGWDIDNQAWVYVDTIKLP